MATASRGFNPMEGPRFATEEISCSQPFPVKRICTSVITATSTSLFTGGCTNGAVKAKSESSGQCSLGDEASARLLVIPGVAEMDTLGMASMGLGRGERRQTTSDMQNAFHQTLHSTVPGKPREHECKLCRRLAAQRHLPAKGTQLAPKE